jgi:sulfonate dioxygenase
VTGEKALYVNQGFTRRIVGYKVEESEYLLKFLWDHIAKGSDFQVRANYKPGTVVVWVSPKNTRIERALFLIIIIKLSR